MPESNVCHWQLVSVVLPWLLPFGVLPSARLVSFFARKATVERENIALIGAMFLFFDNIIPPGGVGIERTGNIRKGNGPVSDHARMECTDESDVLLPTTGSVLLFRFRHGRNCTYHVKPSMYVANLCGG